MNGLSPPAEVGNLSPYLVGVRNKFPGTRKPRISRNLAESFK